MDSFFLRRTPAVVSTTDCSLLTKDYTTNFSHFYASWIRESNQRPSKKILVSSDGYGFFELQVHMQKAVFQTTMLRR